MSELTTVAIAFLAFMAGGMAMMVKLWPMSSVEEVASYLFASDTWGGRSTYERVLNDLDILPYRHLAPVPFTLEGGRNYREVPIAGKRDRRQNPMVFVDHRKREPVATLVAGLTDTTESLYGVLLLGPEGEVLHQWDVRDEYGDGSGEMHGLAMLDDGSLIVAFNKGSSLTRYDACGNEVWRQPIAAHHSVTKDGPGHVWTWEENDMVRVESATGAVDKRIPLEDLASRAPGKYILTGRKFFDMENGANFEFDPFHPNDVEALPAEYADAFPMFEAGDLLVSLRTGSLIMVVDPESRQVLWWMREGSYAQHDPDWHPNGRILLFDNNTGFGKSRIISIDPADKEYDVKLDGEELDFYTDLMGNQHMREEGSILVNLSRQGRVVEYASDGTILFEFVNRYDSEAQQFGLVTEAMTLPMKFVRSLRQCGAPGLTRSPALGQRRQG